MKVSMPIEISKNEGNEFEFLLLIMNWSEMQREEAFIEHRQLFDSDTSI